MFKRTGNPSNPFLIQPEILDVEERTDFAYELGCNSSDLKNIIGFDNMVLNYTYDTYLYGEVDPSKFLLYLYGCNLQGNSKQKGLLFNYHRNTFDSHFKMVNDELFDYVGKNEINMEMRKKYPFPNVGTCRNITLLTDTAPTYAPYIGLYQPKYSGVCIKTQVVNGSFFGKIYDITCTVGNRNDNFIYNRSQVSDQLEDWEKNGTDDIYSVKKYPEIIHGKSLHNYTKALKFGTFRSFNERQIRKLKRYSIVRYTSMRDKFKHFKCVWNLASMLNIEIGMNPLDNLNWNQF